MLFDYGAELWFPVMPFLDKKQKKTTIIIFSLILLISLVAPLLCNAATKPDMISLAMYLPPSLLGEGSSTIFSDMRCLQKILKNEINMEVILDDGSASWEQIVSRLETEKADIAWMPPFYYARARATNKSSKIRPLAIYQINEKIDSERCIYVRQESKIKALEDLLATKIFFPDEAAWMELNSIFSNNKNMSMYDLDPYHFFIGFRLLTRESAVKALLFDQVDAILLEPEYLKYIKDRQSSTLRKIECTEPLPNVIIVYRENLDKRIVDTLLLVLSSLHLDPTFSKLHKYFTPTGGKWVAADEKQLKPWYDIYNDSVIKGWDKTFEALPISD